MSLGVAIRPKGGELVIDRFKAPSYCSAYGIKFINFDDDHCKQAVETALSAVATLTRNKIFEGPVEVQQCGLGSFFGNSGSLSAVYGFLSIHHQKRLKRRIVLTGVVNIHGRIEPIGGVQSKCLVAARYGYKMILPESNRKDYDLCDQEVKNELDVQFVQDVKEIHELIIEGEAEI